MAIDQKTAETGDLSFSACWRRLPEKGLFFGLLAAWLALFHFLGNSTFGYVDTASLFHWMWNAYNSKSPAADDGHGNLIPFVVLALFWWKRKELLAQPMKQWWPGLVLLALALVLHLLGYLVQQPRLCIVSLFLGLYGLMGLVWGRRWLVTCFFPFFLFGFMIPLGSLTEPVTFPLRLAVSKSVAWFCQYILAIDVHSVGTSLIRLPEGFQYDVAAACSGIRSLMAITAISIIYAFTVFRFWSHRILLVALAVPLAFIGNTFRMMVIVLAAEWGGQAAGNRTHESGFWSMLPYVPALIGLMLAGRWLERREARSTAAPASPTDANSGSARETQTPSQSTSTPGGAA